MIVTNHPKVFSNANIRGVVLKNSTKPSLSNQLQVDTVTFSGKKRFETKLDEEQAAYVANKLTTSTSGYRWVWGEDEDYSKEAVKIITEGLSVYSKENYEKGDKKAKTIMIGGDTREGTQKSLPKMAEQLKDNGFDVLYVDKPVPTPMHALAAKIKEIPVSVLMTASHNDWKDVGVNLVTDEGAIAPPSITGLIGDKIKTIGKKEYVDSSFQEKGKIIKFDTYNIYNGHL
ncbi:MAG: hypothetical protein PHV68_08010, partial [Candidatus Gastranaerophilales bacterium]|nr:hypothetical protein [Candidatus Gastranaerophilales bacterium]